MLKKNALLKSVTFVLVMILLLTSAISSIQAQDETVTGSMAVDCSTLSGDALEYAQDNDICPRSGGTAGGVTGAGTGTSTGNCGTVWVTIQGVPDGLTADMSMRAISTLGAITHVSYYITWENFNNGAIGTVIGGTVSNASPIYYSPHHIVTTGTGFVFGTLNGRATVNHILPCIFNPTSTSDTVD